MSQAKIFEENILGGNQQFVGEKKEKNYKRKRNEEQRVRGERRREKKIKNKVVKFFIRCSDSRSSVARELKLVYSMRVMSRY